MIFNYNFTLETKRSNTMRFIIVYTHINSVGNCRQNVAYTHLPTTKCFTGIKNNIR